MRLDLQDCELCLADNLPLRLVRARGVTVSCTAGRVWLTVEGEAGDIFLAAGQSHRVRGNGLALLEAIGSGRVRLQPVPSRWNTLFACISGLLRHRREIFHSHVFGRLINCLQRFLARHQAERRTWQPRTIDVP